MKIPEKLSDSAIMESERKKFGFRLKNEKLKFLILIREEDIVKRFYLFNYAIRDFLIANKKKLPGDLDVLCFDDIDKEDIMRNYIIDSNPIPNQLYIKLQSTNIYVKDDLYDDKNFKLRQNELKNIFVTLGAKKIKYSVKQIKSNNTNVNVGAGVENNTIGVGQEINYNNTTANYIQEECELTFDYSDKINNISYETFNNDSFYFLPKETEWQDIIIRRIKHLQLTDKCVLRNNSDIKINKSLKSNFKMAKINCSHSFGNVDLVKIEYDIEYYSRNENIEKNKLKEIKRNALYLDEPKNDFYNGEMPN